MKSLFLLTLLGALVSSTAMAQTAKKKTKKAGKPAQTVPAASSAAKPSAKPATQTSAMTVSTQAAAPKTHFERFAERLSIGYWGAYLSSPLQNWQADYATVHPDLQTKDGKCDKNCDTDAQNIFSLVTFAYNYGGSNKFIIQPRATVMFGKMTDSNYHSDLVRIEDALVGWSTNLFTSADKKFAWNFRPAVRLPTSTFSRNNFNGGRRGSLTYQPDIVTSFSYTFNDTWSIAQSLQSRHWIYNERYNVGRHRWASWTGLTQKLSDKITWNYNYEYWLETAKGTRATTGKKPSYVNNWQNFYTGPAFDITPKFNLNPMVGIYPDDHNMSMASAYITCWISYQIK